MRARNIRHFCKKKTFLRYYRNEVLRGIERASVDPVNDVKFIIMMEKIMEKYYIGKGKILYFIIM